MNTAAAFTVHPVQLGQHKAWELRDPEGNGLGQFVCPDIPERLAVAYTAAAAISKASASSKRVSA